MKTKIYAAFIILNLLITFCLLSGFICLVSGAELKAQNIGINGTGANAHASALLDIDDTGSNTKGILIPRISLTAINVATPVISPATSLLVYNIAAASTGTDAVSPGYYYWDGIKWVRFAYNPSGTSASAWNLLGNAGTISSTHFLGTTDVQDLVFRTNNIEKMRVTTTGSVGIGVSTPTANLHVYAANGFAGTVLPFRSGITVDIIPASSNGYSIFKGTGGSLLAAGLVYGLNLDLNPTGTTIGTRYGIYTANETKNYFSNRVGIGTANPAFKLHVENGNIAQTFTTNTSHSIYMGNPSGRDWQLYHLSPLDANAPNGFMFEHFDGSIWQRRMTIDQTGNVGIGVVNPSAKLHINQPALGTSGLTMNFTTASFFIQEDTDLQLYTNVRKLTGKGFIFSALPDNPDLVIKDTLLGAVGVGTRNPSTKLHVVSTTSNTAFRMQDGTEGAGKVLTSDVNGNATWQSQIGSWYAHLDNGSSANISGGVSPVNFTNSTILGVGGSVNVTTDLITVPANGLYRVIVSGYASGNTSPYVVYWNVKVNGVVTWGPHNAYPSVSYGSNASAIKVLTLNAGDILTLERDNAGSPAYEGPSASVLFSAEFIK